MNFTQMHERLRQELLRRIHRGTLSVSLLARQSGFGQSHLSNFLRSKRQLSLEALDRVLNVQRLTVSDLLPAAHSTEALNAGELDTLVPVVSYTAALFEPTVKSTPGQEMLRVPSQVLQSARSRVSSARRAWQRFVAIRIQAADAPPMEPLILADSIVLLDRHYNSLVPYRPNRLNLYAVQNETRLVVRYVDFLAERLVLRPHNLAFPVDLIELPSDKPHNDLLAGRVAMIVNEP
jgi:transcriptional regulator with XRE-family HTH domain